MAKKAGTSGPKRQVFTPSKNKPVLDEMKKVIVSKHREGKEILRRKRKAKGMTK